MCHRRGCSALRSAHCALSEPIRPSACWKLVAEQWVAGCGVGRATSPTHLSHGAQSGLASAALKPACSDAARDNAPGKAGMHPIMKEEKPQQIIVYALSELIKRLYNEPGVASPSKSTLMKFSKTSKN